MRHLHPPFAVLDPSAAAPRSNRVRVSGVLVLSLLSAWHCARALEGCAVLPLVEVSAALDPLQSLTVRAGSSADPHIKGCRFESSGDLLLDVIVSEDQTVCDTTMTKFAVGQSAPLTVPNVGDRALFRQQASVAQFVATKGARCIALAMHGESRLAPIDARHALTVLAGDALQRSWSGPALQYWNEPGDQPHPLSRERIQRLQELLQHRQNDRDVLIAVGNLYIQSNGHEQARPYLEKAAALPPPRADLYYDLGEIDWRPVNYFLTGAPPGRLPHSD